MLQASRERLARSDQTFPPEGDHPRSDHPPNQKVILISSFELKSARRPWARDAPVFRGRSSSVFHGAETYLFSRGRGAPVFLGQDMVGSSERAPARIAGVNAGTCGKMRVDAGKILTCRKGLGLCFQPFGFRGLDGRMRGNAGIVQRPGTVSLFELSLRPAVLLIPR